MTLQSNARFDGETYSHEHDHARLKGQLQRVFQCMSDRRWRTLTEIKRLTGDSRDASVSARLRDLRKVKFGGHRVRRRARGERNKGLFEYKLILNDQSKKGNMAKSKSLGQFTDELYDKDLAIDKIEKQLREAKQERAELEKEFLDAFKAAQIDGCKGKRGAATVQRASYPSISNRKKFERYILKNKAFDLFQSRVTAKAYFARLEEGETVPGVKVFERVRVSVRKRSAR